MISAVHPATDIAKILRHVRFVPILLKKSLLADEQNFSGPLMRFAWGDEGPHRFIPKRPPTFVLSPESLAAAGASKNRL
jgi:hypothetical protein